MLQCFASKGAPPFHVCLLWTWRLALRGALHRLCWITAQKSPHGDEESLWFPENLKTQAWRSWHLSQRSNTYFGTCREKGNELAFSESRACDGNYTSNGRIYPRPQARLKLSSLHGDLSTKDWWVDHTQGSDAFAHQWLWMSPNTKKLGGTIWDGYFSRSK